MISVLIITKNEEHDLPHCLATLTWTDDVHVFDSFSSDKTLDIAKKAGAHVSQRAFDGYASQRNAALKSLSFKYEWILILDADERVSIQLVEEMQSAVKEASPNHSAFRLRRKDYFFGKWLKHSQISPFYIRLVKKGMVIYHREINEVLEVDGHISELNHSFDHFPFSKGISHWIDKHNRYSSMEAQRCIMEQSDEFQFSVFKALFSKDFHQRRYHQKGLFYKLPGRPFIKWFYMVFIKKAFLDGFAGITYASLQSIYEYFIFLKTKEIRNNNH